MKSIKSIMIITLMILFPYYAFNQRKDNPYADKIKQEAERMSMMFSKNEHGNFIEYIYPEILKRIRGRRDLITLLKNNIESIKIKSLTLGEPSKIIVCKGELQCTIPETMELIVEKKRMIIKSTLIAISQDKGKRWYFVDANQDIETLKIGLPNLSDSLIIPPKERPVILDY